MRPRGLFELVLATNFALACAASLIAALIAGLDPSETVTVGGVVIGAGILAIVVNQAVLRRQFKPLETLIEEMEKVDLSLPGGNLPASIDGKGETEEVERIELAFLRMMRRLEAERRRSSSAALRAQEQERARIARDLHDEVNQSLTGVLLRLEAARDKAPPELDAELAETKVLANQAMQELVQLARQLRPTALDDLGLVAALSTQVKELDRLAGIQASFTSDGELTSIPDDIALVIYRVAQESLSNATRHSGASSIEVRLTRKGEMIELTVADDGSGFAFDDAESGLGLPGMRERALLVDGEITIESSPSRGTTVRLRVNSSSQS